jgi:mRNA-degrading endonuclease HigB of HigAB toxin-antitoxin module
MKRLIITEEEKKDILGKYTEADDKILRHLRRNYPIFETPEEFRDLVGKYKIMVDDKAIIVLHNVKRLVDKIDLEIKDIFPNVSDVIRRQTIKKFVKNFEE